MLQRKVLEPRTLDLLKELMALPSLVSYNLVGGTALALQYGHRLSNDLDFFGNVDAINAMEIQSDLEATGDTQITTQSRIMLGCQIDGVKVDIVKYKYKLLFEPIVLDGIRLALPQDIASMKLAAITGRGKRKDFYDFYYLLQHYSLDEMFTWYDQKYPDGNRLLVYRSLTYFEDAEGDEDPYLFDDISWEEVKSFIEEKVKAYLVRPSL